MVSASINLVSLVIITSLHSMHCSWVTALCCCSELLFTSHSSDRAGCPGLASSSSSIHSLQCLADQGLVHMCQKYGWVGHTSEPDKLVGLLWNAQWGGSQVYFHSPIIILPLSCLPCMFFSWLKFSLHSLLTSRLVAECRLHGLVWVDSLASHKCLHLTINDNLSTKTEKQPKSSSRSMADLVVGFAQIKSVVKMDRHLSTCSDSF